MEASVADLFSDTEIDDLNLTHQWELSSIDQEFPTLLWECFEESLSPESYNSSTCLESPTSPPGVDQGPEKQPAATAKSWKSSATTTGILSFGNPNSSGELQPYSFKNADAGFEAMELLRVEELMADGKGVKRAKAARSRPVALNHEHVIAERKRREKITEKLIELSAIIPGLKKRDKASILTDAIAHMKQMEEKLRTLEGQAAIEPAVAVKRSRLSDDSDENSSDDGGPPSDGSTPPDIEARISEKSALIRIHCQKRKGLLVKALAEIEKHHLTVVNSSVLHFSDRFLDITVIAQVEEGFSMTVKDLLKKLHSAFRKFI